MQPTYKDKIIREIEELPEHVMPKIYKIVHILITELNTQKPRVKRGSLKGIWQGCHIDDSLISESKKSLFPYK